MSYKVLKKVKETFDIFNDGRKHNPAPQKWVLSALKNVISNSHTKERISLNEAEGFYGHTIRERSGKINPSEMELIEQNGKLVAVNVIPAIRTVSLSIDDYGNVTHEQEFLDTDPGRAALSAYEAGSGGFSWAFSGGDGIGGREAKAFSAFDYVRQPNFIPKHRQQALFSSVSNEKSNQLLISSMVNSGIEKELASSMVAQYSQSCGDDQVIENLLLSELLDREEKREKLLVSAIEQSPFFISESQKKALLRCNDDDVEELNLLFSAMQNTDLSHLPLNEVKPKEERQFSTAYSYPSFERPNMRFRK